MFFDLSLYLALLICALGLAYKVWSWLRADIGPEASQYSPGQRARAALQSMLSTALSRQLGKMLRVLLLDGLLQRRSWRVSKLAGFSHLCLFAGFLLLLVLHALGRLLIEGLLGEYYPSLNPYLFLRNLAGLMVLVGAGLAVYRRISVKSMRITTRRVDTIAIALLAVILISGFGLEAIKISSPAHFSRMVAEYADPENQREVQALKAFWGHSYGVVFPGKTKPDPKLLAAGRQAHNTSCAECHSAPQWALGSYLLSRALKPAAATLTSGGLSQALYYIHFLASFLGLALLPFSKFLHLFTTPMLLMINAVNQREEMDPAARTLLRALELDACMHCAVCSIHCSVGVALRHTPNLNILPSEKLASLAVMARGKSLDKHELAIIREGCYICTSCWRCTKLCTAGINLQDLWFAQKEDLIKSGLGEPYEELAGAADAAAQGSRRQRVLRVRHDGFQNQLQLSAQASSFSSCYACQTCTNVCPVVMQYHWPVKELDLLPHQIMHSLGLGLREEALGARMVWYCLTCYHCQEACPMGVQVADVLFELRNLAASGGGEQGS